MIKNYMEILVEENMQMLLHTDYTGICTCDKCLDDIRAKALNNIKPFYVTSVKGEIYGRFSSLVQQTHIDILQATLEAIQWVAAHPHT